MSRTRAKHARNRYRVAVRRYTSALAVSLAVAASGLVVAVSSGQTAEALIPRQTTLTAPAAPTPVVMGCSAGRIDLNHATAAQLQTLPTPDGSSLSSPAAGEIIAGRPYLQPTDLKAPAVTGITDNHVALWRQRGLVCLTPIFTTASDGTSVPVTPDVCTSTGQADLNDKRDYSRFASLFNRPTADRLVAGMPYPSVKNALRRAGVAAGQLKKYDGLICATPYPVRYSGVDWAFATPEDGVAVSTAGGFGNYTLTVPTGVTGGNGSWASAEETRSTVAENAGVTSLHLDNPSVDAHIHGLWSGSVGVTLPADPTDLGDGYVDSAIHYSSTHGPMLFANDARAIGPDGRITVAEQDLSVTSSIKLAQRWVSGITNAAVSLATQMEKVLRASLGLGGTAVCNPDVTGQDLGDGAAFDVTGAMLSNGLNFTPRLSHCVTRTSSDAEPRGHFVDNRGAVLPVDDYSTSRLSGISNGGGLLWSLIASGWNLYAAGHDHPVLLGPGDSMDAQPASYQGHFHVVTNAVPVGLLSVAYQALDEVSSGLPPQLKGLFQGSDCTQQFVAPLLTAASGSGDPLDTVFADLGTGFSCFAKYLSNITEGQGGYELVQRFLPHPTVGNAETAGVILDRLKRAVLALKLAKYASVVADVIDVSLADGDVTMSWKPPAPPGPATDGKGRAVLPRCVTKTFSYSTGWSVTVDQTCQDLGYADYTSVGTTPPSLGAPQNAFDDWNGLINSDRLYNALERDAGGTLYLVLLEDGQLVAHPIQKAEEAAFKADWPEHEWVSQQFPTLIDRIGSTATNDPLRLRLYTEGRGGNWLLRQSDGTAWFIDENGVRHWLPSVAAQEAVATNHLTFDPAQYAHDVCLYPQPGDTGLRVC